MQNESASSTESSESFGVSAENSVENSSVEKTGVCLDGIIYTLTDGEYTVTGYEGEETSLSIESEVDGLPVTAIGERAFYQCATLTSVTIPDSITEIGACAFYGCSGLTGMEILDSVTGIGENAFAHCHRLKTAIIGDGVTEIGAWAFYYCHALTSVTIGDGVASIGVGAFQECFNLTSVVLGIGVQFIGSAAFGWCNSLTNVYYKGGSREWAEIQAASNTELISAKRYYYVENEDELPTSGNYWHYDENGEVAVW